MQSPEKALTGQTDRELEAELLLCCASTQLSSPNEARIRALSQQHIDWDRLTQAALQHSLLPLLYTHLSRLCPDALPETSLTQLRQYYYANELHNRMLTETLLSLLQLFNEQGIVTIPFKGPSLAVAAYGHLALRQFGDLDLFVKKQDLISAMRLLLAQGYTLKSESLTVDAELIKPSRCAYTFFHDQDQLAVDLHWGITAAIEYPYRDFALPLDSIRLWEHLVAVQLGTASVPSFLPAHLLLILCIHGSKHQWERLGWLCDISQLIQVHPDIHWDQLTAHANQIGCRRMLDLGLALAHRLLNTPLPDQITERLQADARLQALVGDLEADALVNAKPSAGLISRAVFYLRMRERLRDKVRYALHLAHLALSPTAKDNAFLALPKLLSPLYYIVRPLRLASEYRRKSK